jgi:pimeloyl-ACP methyl ester carboxylesterase
MPFLQRGGASIYYEEYGSGYPILTLAPGSLSSTIDAWHRSPWDPTVELASEYHVIAMDQRNAGQSRAPISAGDNWDTYLADHLALLDHLGIEKAHIMGACIGVSFGLRIAEEQPDRVSALVLQQPIGATQTRKVSDSWRSWLKSLEGRSDATEAALDSFYHNLYDPLFVYSVSRDFVRSCPTPMLILPGNDESHPHVIAEELAELAPNAEFIDPWREAPANDAAFARVREFLRSHTPVTSR